MRPSPKLKAHNARTKITLQYLAATTTPYNNSNNKYQVLNLLLRTSMHVCYMYVYMYTSVSICMHIYDTSTYITCKCTCIRQYLYVCTYMIHASVFNGKAAGRFVAVTNPNGKLIPNRYSLCQGGWEENLRKRMLMLIACSKMARMGQAMNYTKKIISE